MAWILGLAAAYVAGLLLVAWLSLRPFRTPLFLSPGFMGTPQEEVSLVSDDGVTLGAWWVEGPEDGPVALLVHGYMMNRCELAPMAPWLWRLGFSCLLPDLRAHGRSGGDRTGLGWKERLDVLAALRWIQERRPNSRVVLVGSSMGGAACAFALAERPDLADCAVLDSVYSRLDEAIPGWWEFLLGRWARWLLAPVTYLARPMAGFDPRRADVAEAIRGLSGDRLLWVHGDRDVLSPPAHALRNASATDPPGQVLWMPGCNHSEGRWIHPTRFYDGVFGFLRARAILSISPGSDDSSGGWTTKEESHDHA
ncbi:MAG: lysophospholipase [Fimbriimonadales bacterium]|nr:lysophospholipase [Fimbriimonadales bacterium]